MKRSAPLTRKVGLKPSTKRMKQRHRAIGPANDAQQAYQDSLREKGCAMCALLLSIGAIKRACPLPVRIHHRTIGDLHGQLQLSQGDVVPLCDWHHQGVIAVGYTLLGMLLTFGASLHHHKRAFLTLLQDHLGERSTAALQRYAENMT